MGRVRQVVRLALVTLVISTVLLACVGLANLGALYQLQHRLEDAALSGRSREPDSRIVLVAIDDASLSIEKKKWPWPRQLVASLLDRIAAGQPAVVGVDLLLLDADSDNPAGDRALASSLARLPRAVLVGKLVFSSAASSAPPELSRPMAPLLRHASTGFFNLTPDSDQVVRRQRLVAPVGGRVEPAFAYAIYLSWRDAHPDQPDHRPTEPVLRIPYAGPAGTFASVPASAVLASKIPSATFAGRIVLVGATFTDAKDRFPTPMRDREDRNQMAGVEIHANLVQALLQGSHPREASSRVAALGALLLILIVVATSRLLPWRGTVAVAVSLAILSLALPLWLLRENRALLPSVPWCTSCLLALVVVMAERRRSHQRERRRQGNVMRIVLPEVPQKSGAAEQPMTLLFIEVLNFTAVAESLIGRGLGRYLSSFLDGLSNIIDAHGGNMNQDISTGLVAVFGLDPRQLDHADRSCRAALEIARTVGSMQERWREEIGAAFHVSVGIHCCQVRTMVSRQGEQLLCTLVSSQLKAGLRLAALARKHGTHTLVSEDVARQLPDAFRLEPLGEILIRGRKAPTAVLGLLGDACSGPTQAVSTLAS